MNKVPVMISTKDLAYITDMLNWNFIACKKAHHFQNEVEDEMLKKMIGTVADMHKKHFETLLNLLG